MAPSQAFTPSVSNSPTFPLSHIIQRTLRAIYSEWTQTLDLLPRLSDTDRRVQLLRLLLRTRYFFMKLLVLVRHTRDCKWPLELWKQRRLSSSNPWMQCADQLAGIQQTVSQFARMGQADLSSALDTLTFGEDVRLPRDMNRFLSVPCQILRSQSRLQPVSQCLPSLSQVTRDQWQMHIIQRFMNFSLPKGLVLEKINVEQQTITLQCHAYKMTLMLEVPLTAHLPALCWQQREWESLGSTEWPCSSVALRNREATLRAVQQRVLSFIQWQSSRSWWSVDELGNKSNSDESTVQQLNALGEQHANVSHLSHLRQTLQQTRQFRASRDSAYFETMHRLCLDYHLHLSLHLLAAQCPSLDKTYFKTDSRLSNKLLITYWRPREKCSILIALQEGSLVVQVQIENEVPLRNYFDKVIIGGVCLRRLVQTCISRHILALMRWCARQLIELNASVNGNVLYLKDESVSMTLDPTSGQLSLTSDAMTNWNSQFIQKLENAIHAFDAPILLKCVRQLKQIQLLHHFKQLAQLADLDIIEDEFLLTFSQLDIQIQIAMEQVYFYHLGRRERLFVAKEKMNLNEFKIWLAEQEKRNKYFELRRLCHEQGWRWKERQDHVLELSVEGIAFESCLLRLDQSEILFPDSFPLYKLAVTRDSTLNERKLTILASSPVDLIQKLKPFMRMCQCLVASLYSTLLLMTRERMIFSVDGHTFEFDGVFLCLASSRSWLVAQCCLYTRYILEERHKTLLQLMKDIVSYLPFYEVLDTQQLQIRNMQCLVLDLHRIQWVFETGHAVEWIVYEGGQSVCLRQVQSSPGNCIWPHFGRWLRYGIEGLVQQWHHTQTVTASILPSDQSLWMSISLFELFVKSTFLERFWPLTETFDSVWRWAQLTGHSLDCHPKLLRLSVLSPHLKLGIMCETKHGMWQMALAGTGPLPWSLLDEWVKKLLQQNPSCVVYLWQNLLKMTCWKVSALKATLNCFIKENEVSVRLLLEERDALQFSGDKDILRCVLIWQKNNEKLILPLEWHLLQRSLVVWPRRFDSDWYNDDEHERWQRRLTLLQSCMDSSFPLDSVLPMALNAFMQRPYFFHDLQFR